MGITDIAVATRDFLFSKPRKVEVALAPTVKVRGDNPPPNYPTTRQSLPSDVSGVLTEFSKDYKVIQPKTFVELIPVIRRIVALNADLGQAVHNIVSLGNTGHKIFFDPGVPEAQVDAMRKHIQNRQTEWASGQATMDGVVNRMFSQLVIGGALSCEWVPNTDLTGIESVLLVNPEEIRFVLDKRSTKYLPHQIPTHTFGGTLLGSAGLKKLNPNTYKYFALNGDGEVPYGTPPYLTAMEPLARQKNMLKNLDHVVNQLGIFGFLAVLMSKPDQADNENDSKYQERLVNYLNSVRSSVSNGFKEGIIAGFKDDTEFDFNSIGRDFEQVATIFQENELQIASGAKQDATLWGRGYSTSETQITVVFTKLLSELRNMQTIVGAMLNFGYRMDLQMAGFKFEYLNVQFNTSTIQDELKMQQAMEYKIKNFMQLYLMGTINEQQFADAFNFAQPAEAKPRVALEILAGGSNPADAASADDKRQGQKNKSAKKERDKKKPQGSKKS